MKHIAVSAVKQITKEEHGQYTGVNQIHKGHYHCHIRTVEATGVKGTHSGNNGEIQEQNDAVNCPDGCKPRKIFPVKGRVKEGCS